MREDGAGIPHHAQGVHGHSIGVGEILEVLQPGGLGGPILGEMRTLLSRLDHGVQSGVDVAQCGLGVAEDGQVDLTVLGDALRRGIDLYDLLLIGVAPHRRLAPQVEAPQT